MAGIFYILIGGLVLALGVAFFEFLYWSRVDAKQHKVMKKKIYYSLHQLKSDILMLLYWRHTELLALL